MKSRFIHSLGLPTKAVGKEPCQKQYSSDLGQCFKEEAIQVIPKGDDYRQCDGDVKCDDSNIALQPAAEDHDYLVEDFKGGMFFGGAVATVNFFLSGHATFAPMCAGVGLLVLLEGNTKSERITNSYTSAQNLARLKRPKTAKDVAYWQIGDRISYELGAGAIIPVGAQVFGFGVGLAPILQGSWQVGIVKTGPSTFNVRFARDRSLTFRIGAGSLFGNTTISFSDVEGSNKTYAMDIATPEGEQLFNDLMGYKRLFKGGTKQLKDAVTPGEFEIHNAKLAAMGTSKYKTTNFKKFGVFFPVAGNWSIGTKMDKAKAEETIFADGQFGQIKNKLVLNRRTDYRNMKVLRNIFKKNQRQFPHRVRQRQGVDQGVVAYINADKTISAEASYNHATDELHGKDNYDKAIKRMTDFFDLRDLQPKIVWPAEVKYKRAFIAATRVKLSHDALMHMTKNRERLNGVYAETRDQNKALLELIDNLIKIEGLYYRLGTDEALTKLLQNTINLIRKDYWLIRTIGRNFPGALEISLEFSGSLITPHKKTINLAL